MLKLKAEACDCIKTHVCGVLSPAMHHLRRLTILLLPLCFVSCADFHPQPLLAKVVLLSYADFGPADLASPLLGPGAGSEAVVVHYGLPQSHLAARYPGSHTALVVPAIRHLNRVIHELPHDAAHAALRSRLLQTRARLMEFYNSRRIAFNSVPPFVGRGFMARQALMPALGTTR
jgi:hypothetical protein